MLPPGMLFRTLQRRRAAAGVKGDRTQPPPVGASSGFFLQQNQQHLHRCGTPPSPLHNPAGKQDNALPPSERDGGRVTPPPRRPRPKENKKASTVHYTWHITHAPWNSLMHALHGNTVNDTAQAPTTAAGPGRREKLKGQPQSKIRFRFHNVAGLSDPKFRKSYLHQARASTDILVVAETNCNLATTPISERTWGQDWVNGGPGPFWASATNPSLKTKGRGMAIFFSNNTPVEAARLTYPRPKQVACGRIIVVTARLYGQPTHIIGFHADCADDRQLHNSLKRLALVISDLPVAHDLVLLSYHNHCISPSRDYFSSTGATGGTTNHDKSRHMPISPFSPSMLSRMPFATYTRKPVNTLVAPQGDRQSDIQIPY